MTNIQTDAASNKAIVNNFFDALNRGDVAGVVAAYAEDGTVQTMGSTLISGIHDREHIASATAGIFDVFPEGLRFTVKGMVAEGDKVAVEAESEGEHVSGKVYNNQYHFLFQFRAGKLVALREYMDTEMVTDVLCGGQRPPFDT